MAEEFEGQPYLDQLRPDRGWSVRVAFLTTYSADPIAIGATLLAMTGRNSDIGSGNAADFAESIERMRDRLRVIVQRGRLHRRPGMPKVIGVLDQFIVEQHYNEDNESWHPKLALIGYEGPAGEHTWRFWIGSRNLTPSRDLDLGLLIEGENRKRKAARPIPDLTRIGGRLARLAALDGFPTDILEKELSAISWRAPDGIRIDAVQLRVAGDPPTTPLPVGKMDRIVSISPFLCPRFVSTMSGWGDAKTERVLLTTVQAVRGLTSEAKAKLKQVHLLALAPPEPELDIEEPAADAGMLVPTPATTGTDTEVEPPPVSLHAKLFAFRSKSSVKIVMGSANATERAWGGRNAEATVTFVAGPSIVAGIDAILGSAMPIPAEILTEPTTSTDKEAAEILDRCRRRLVSNWPLSIIRTGKSFVIAAKQHLVLGTTGIRLEAGLVTGTILPWSLDDLTLDLGEIPLAWQTDLIQLRLTLDDDSCGWMQRVKVTPSIEPGRDPAAIARFLGVHSFYAWMRGLLDGDIGAPDSKPWERHHHDPDNKNLYDLGLEHLTLEDILTAWARDRTAFQRADTRFETYITAILTHDDTISSDDRRALISLQSIWAAARLALMSTA